MNSQKKVLFVSGEVYPFIKTGGLGDVAYSLPKILEKEGVDIRVILPKYDQIPWEYKSKMKHIGNKKISLAWREEYLGIEELVLDNITYYFVDNEYYFKRNNVYGEMDDCERFAFFSKAIIESFDITGFYPDIIHSNDWHTGLVPLYLNERKREGIFKNIKNIFTIHNLKFQGSFSYSNIEWVLGIDPNYYFHEDGIKFHDNFSFLKAGVNYSDIVTTVSQSYAEEIKTSYYGENLEGLFSHHNNKLFGIVNGIDYDIFNPEKDLDIEENFSSKNIENKYINKSELQKKLYLQNNKHIPIVSIITRLDKQKGLDLIIHIFDELLETTECQFVLLGNGEPHYESFFREKALQYPGRVSCTIGFNNILAKEIYASSDIFLMPSQFEPCGLSQLISMRYGTIPLVRETGGLRDTVIPFNEFGDHGTGFTFSNYNAHDMLHVIKYAFSIYYKPKLWKNLVKRAMKADHSWSHSGKKYLELYKKTW
ncbi:MAG: glycogen synthase GlgA [Fusobacteriaceae bacterium]